MSALSDCHNYVSALSHMSALSQTVIIMWAHCQTYMSALSQTVICECTVPDYHICECTVTDIHECAVNMQGFVWKFFLRYIYKFSFIHSLLQTVVCECTVTDWHTWVHCHRLSYVSALSQTDIHECTVTDCYICECTVTDCCMWVHCHQPFWQVHSDFGDIMEFIISITMNITVAAV